MRANYRPAAADARSALVSGTLADATRLMNPVPTMGEGLAGGVGTALGRTAAACIVGLSLVGSCTLDRFGTGAAPPDASLGGTGGLGGVGGFGGLGATAGTSGSGGFPDVATGGVGGSGGSDAAAGASGGGGTAPTDAGSDAGGSAGAGGAGGSGGVDAGPPKPTDFPGLLLWVKADVGVILSGTTVQTWQDLSGNANHLGQAPGGGPPDLNPTGINGKPSVHFSPVPGVPDVLAGKQMKFTAGTTIMLVYRLDNPSPAPTSYGEIFGNRNDTDPLSMFRLGVSGASQYKSFFFGPSNPSLVRADLGLDALAHLLEVTWTGASPSSPASYTASHDGTPISSVLGAGTSTPPNLTGIGSYLSTSAQLAFQGHIGELVVFDHVLLDADRAKISKAIRTAWALP